MIYTTMDASSICKYNVKNVPPAALVPIRYTLGITNGGWGALGSAGVVSVWSGGISIKEFTCPAGGASILSCCWLGCGALS